MEVAEDKPPVTAEKVHETIDNADLDSSHKPKTEAAPSRADDKEQGASNPVSAELLFKAVHLL